jgi:hypothetical protein
VKKIGTRKHFLRSGNIPETGYNLSGVVKVVAAEATYNAYIRFSACLVDTVGDMMPRGISDDDPCYLLLEENPVTKTWTLYGKYLYSNEKVRFKVYTSLPEWVKLKGQKNGETST